MRSSSGCCPRLGKPLSFQPVFACVSKSLEESSLKMRNITLLCWRDLLGIASEMLEFLEQREQRINPKIYSLPSREKNNLW